MPRQLVMGGVVVSDVPTAIALYAPKKIPPTIWTAIAPFVRGCVTAAQPTSPWAAADRMSTVARFCAWALEEHLPLEREVLFTPDAIERYALVGMDPLLPSTRRTHRSQLSSIGRAITRRAPWPPATTPLPRNRLANPYTPDQVARYLAAAGNQATETRRRAAFGILAAGLGAGLMPGEHLTITGRSVTTTRDGNTTVTVQGSRCRSIPVLTAYAPLIRTLADRYPDEPLVGPSHDPGKNRLNRLLAKIEIPRNLPHLNAGSLRSTWLLTLLAARVPLPAILTAAGLTSTSFISDLIPHLPRMDETEAHRTIARALLQPPQVGP